MHPNIVSGGLLVAKALKNEGGSVMINIWVDPNEYAPGTKNQTMYK
jgi:acetolactate synthase I/II/III large subunit